MTTQTTQSTAERLAAAMRDADWDAITATYAADVLLDMNLPPGFSVPDPSLAGEAIEDEEQLDLDVDAPEFVQDYVGED